MAQKILKLAKSHQVCVVVSAMGNTTSELMHLVSDVSQKKQEIAEISGIVGMGEVISARLMAMAISNLGGKTVSITPESPKWPLIVQVSGDAKIERGKVKQDPLATIDVTKTKEKCRQHILPLLEGGVVTVLCGFLGVTKSGQIVAIGRGGSDISAIALGRCIEADRVIIVTDVPGVLPVDPRIVPTKNSVKKISLTEIESLSRGGARVVHPGALQYKSETQSLFIVDYKSENFLKGGTEIIGHKKADIQKTPEHLACITIVGQDFIKSRDLLSNLSSKLSEMKIAIYGVSVSENYIGLYVREKDISTKRSHSQFYKAIAREKKFNAFSVRGGITRINLSHTTFIDQPGIIGRIGDSLAKNNINILEMITLQSDITLFLESADAARAMKTLKNLTI
jgi:aspartate kinase